MLMAEELMVDLLAPELAAMAKWEAATIQHLPAEMHAVVDTVVITTTKAEAKPESADSSCPKVVQSATILTVAHKAVAKIAGTSVQLAQAIIVLVPAVVLQQEKVAPTLAMAVDQMAVSRRKASMVPRSAWSTKKNSSTPMHPYA